MPGAISPADRSAVCWRVRFPSASALLVYQAEAKRSSELDIPALVALVAAAHTRDELAVEMGA